MIIIHIHKTGGYVSFMLDEDNDRILVRGKFINKSDILTNTKLIVVLVLHSTRREIDDMKQRSTMNCRPNICGYAAIVIFVCMAVLGLPRLSYGK